MKTDKVYFADVYRVEAVETYYHRYDINFIFVKPALLLEKRNIFGKKYMYDLNTKQKYDLCLSTKLGALHVSRRTLEKFNDVLGMNTVDLPKEKVLKLGNHVLKNKETLKKEK